MNIFERNKPITVKAKRFGLTFWILVGLAGGIVAGIIAHSMVWGDLVLDQLDPAIQPTIKDYINEQLKGFKLCSDVFLSLVKVIVAPLVFSLLLVGLVKTGNFKAMGRIGLKTMVYFTGATLIALSMGLIIVNIFEPGKALIEHGMMPIVGSSNVQPKTFDLAEFVLHIFPKNIIDAMAHNDILPIIVFVLFFASAVAAVGEKGKIVLDFFDSISHIMLKVTSYVMYFAPVAVFGAVANVIGQNGLGILIGYLPMIGYFFLGLVVFVFGVLPTICYFFGVKYWHLLKLIREPMMIAFGTSSSEAAMPKTITALERFGCPDRIIGFVLPLGYSFNLDGSIMYMTFATVTIAQFCGIDMPIKDQIIMMLMLLVTSKGLAGVPRASLVVIAGMCAAFGIPDTGILLIMAVDWLLDMGRSATNVAGNAVATAVVSKWEKALGDSKPQESPS